MTLTDFIYLAEMYTKLGGAVQEQFDAIVNGEELDEQNPNALRIIRRLLGVLREHLNDEDGSTSELIERLDDYFEELEQRSRL